MSESELKVTYDRASDVLYLTTRPGVPARSRHGRMGLVLRYDVETDEPIGVTVVDFAEFWRHRIDELVDEIAAHLRTSRHIAYEAVRSQLH
jgi:uncharacterized protein YuzE